MKSISEIRGEYSKSSLDISAVNKDPVLQFEQWIREAISSQALEPNAMSLATISENGTPSSRIVLLKGIANGKFLFYTNFQSQKGKALGRNPACALNFFWPELERQVRIEGVAVEADTDAAEKYFQSRPRASQIGAWASPQSAPVASREILEARAREIETRFKDKPVLPKPKQWGGYEVIPVVIEFWQGRPGRLHDRIVFTRVDGEWKINRLAP
jgi:pyridoxamine 5'-phosphate oxidase